MNVLISFLLFFTFNLKAEQEAEQIHQPGTFSDKKNSVPLNQTIILNTEKKIKTNFKPPVSKIKSLKKSDSNLNKKTLPLPESHTKNPPSLSSTENKNIFLQPVNSIDKQTLSPPESHTKNPSSLSSTENKKPLLQSHSTTNKESPSVESSEDAETSQKKSPFSIELETEGTLIKNLLSKNQKGLYPHIPYVDLSFEYDILSDLKFFTELGFSSKQNLWNTNLEQVGLFYRSNIFDLKIGLIPISLGYSYFNSKIFVHPLKFYKPFTTNPMDTGLRLAVPLYKEHLTFTVGRFKGYSKRALDNHYKSPEFAPLTVSLKGKGLSWNGFITYLKQDLAFKEPVNAIGGGFIFKTPVSSEFLISLQGEIWGSEERLQSSFSYYFFPKLSLNKYELIVLFGEIKNFVPNFKTSEATSSIYKWILQGSYELFPGVFLIGERSITKQKEGPLLDNLWALRLKTKIEF